MKISVVIPTTGDRSELTALAIQSLSHQTLQDYEVLIIGDGVAEASRTVYGRMAATLPNCRFFDFPKHPRRGEPNRHEVLMKHARGEVVAYLCDRDLLLPNHLEVHYDTLRTHDFCTSTCLLVQEDQRIIVQRVLHYGDGRDHPVDVRIGEYALSSVSHRLDFYKTLPHGWRTTPAGQATDVYMWRQFLEQKACRFWISPEPTVLFFRRGEHPGWPVAKRICELQQWSDQLHSEQGLSGIYFEVCTGLIKDLHLKQKEIREMRLQLKAWILFKGLKFTQWAKILRNRLRLG
jgi:glycosyltransferase involved in cell wall biosynthesis